MYHGISRRVAAVGGGALLATSLFSTAAVPSLAQSPAAPACDSLNMLYATVEADVDAIKVGIPLYEQATGTKINLDSQPYNALQQKVFAELAQQSPFYDIIIVDTPWMPAITNQVGPLLSYINDPAKTDAAKLAIDDFIPKVFYDTAVYNQAQS